MSGALRRLAIDRVADFLAGLAVPDGDRPDAFAGPGSAAARPAFGEAEATAFAPWPGRQAQYDAEGCPKDPVRAGIGQYFFTALVLGFAEVRALLLGLTQEQDVNSALAAQYFRFSRALGTVLEELRDDGASLSMHIAAIRRIYAPAAAPVVVEVSGGGGAPALSNALPAEIGTAAAGVASLASRGDHVHALTAAGVPSGIDAAKIADGSVDDAEFQTLGGINTSLSIQDQLDALAARIGALEAASPVQAETAGAALAIGTAAYLASSGKILAEDATFLALREAFAGFTTSAAAADGDPVTVAGNGARATGLTGIVIGTGYYVSAGVLIAQADIDAFVAGSSSGVWYRFVGTGDSATSIKQAWGAAEKVP
jgi:hypothetical protein